MINFETSEQTPDQLKAFVDELDRIAAPSERLPGSEPPAPAPAADRGRTYPVAPTNGAPASAPAPVVTDPKLFVPFFTVLGSLAAWRFDVDPVRKDEAQQLSEAFVPVADRYFPEVANEPWVGFALVAGTVSLPRVEQYAKAKAEREGGKPIDPDSFAGVKLEAVESQDGPPEKKPSKKSKGPSGLGFDVIP